MHTCLVCPILCALSCACKSTCGFQSESRRITISAEAKFIPNPPARVLSINRNFSDPSLLNSSINACLSSWGVCPSSLEY